VIEEDVSHTHMTKEPQGSGGGKKKQTTGREGQGRKSREEGVMCK
jgi:hypothetical protein